MFELLFFLFISENDSNESGKEKKMFLLIFFFFNFPFENLGSACGKGSVDECIQIIAESINLAHQKTRSVKTGRNKKK